LDAVKAEDLHLTTVADLTFEQATAR